MQEEILQQKSTIALELKTMIDELDFDYPWIVAEMVFLMYERLDKNLPFIKDILENVLKHLTDEEINGVMECTQEADKQKLFSAILGERINAANMHALLAQAQDMEAPEQKSYCAPEDDTPTSVGLSTENAMKAMKKLNLHSKLLKDKDILLKHKNAIEALGSPDDLKEVSIAINTILEVATEKDATVLKTMG